MILLDHQNFKNILKRCLKQWIFNYISKFKIQQNPSSYVPQYNFKQLIDIHLLLYKIVNYELHCGCGQYKEIFGNEMGIWVGGFGQRVIGLGPSNRKGFWVSTYWGVSEMGSSNTPLTQIPSYQGMNCWLCNNSMQCFVIVMQQYSMGSVVVVCVFCD